MANNNYPQITSVTSESLQAQIRNLLPSQEGFGTDLMAQNVIVPVIDLTSAAEGSTVGQNLQTAMAFGSQTAFSANNSTAVIANTAGFWQITAALSMQVSASQSVAFTMSNGLSSKTIWELIINNTSGSFDIWNNDSVDFVVFLASGESISAVASNRAYVQGSARQIATVNGDLVNPSGFNPQ